MWYRFKSINARLLHLPSSLHRRIRVLLKIPWDNYANSRQPVDSPALNSFCTTAKKRLLSCSAERDHCEIRGRGEDVTMLPSIGYTGFLWSLFPRTVMQYPASGQHTSNEVSSQIAISLQRLDNGCATHAKVPLPCFPYMYMYICIYIYIYKS